MVALPHMAALFSAVVDDASAETRLAHFMQDCKHPTSQGHTYIAQLILGRILATDNSAASRDAPVSGFGRPRPTCKLASQHGRRAVSLPPPT